MSGASTYRMFEGADHMLGGMGAAFRDVGEYIIARIKERTRLGMGLDGKAFAPYGERHTKRRMRRGQSVAPVNLDFDGNMLDDIQVLSQTGGTFEPKGRGARFRNDKGQFTSASNVEVTIGFSDPMNEHKAMIHQTGRYRGVTKPRPWFGITEQEATEMVDIFHGKMTASAPAGSPTQSTEIRVTF